MRIKNSNGIWIDYFILKAVHRGYVQDFYRLLNNNEIYLTAGLELNTSLEMAHLESRSLANRFREACIKRLKKKYGNMFDIEIVGCSTLENTTIRKRIVMDSRKIKRHLADKNSSHNNRTTSPALSA